MLARPCSRHCSASTSAWCWSITKCTARSSSGRSVRPNCMARDGEVEPIDEHHHHQPAAHRRGDGLRHFVDEGVVLALVLLREPHQDHDHHRHEDHDHPRALRELEICDHQRDHRRHDRAGAVDEQAPAPALFLVCGVMLGHAGLRQRERREHADRVERDEPVDLGVGRDQHHDAGDGQEDDAVREHEPVAALGELAGHEVVAGVERREAGKSAKLVFAASTRISIVPAWRQ